MICWVRSARRTASSVGSASVSSSELVWSDCVRSEEHTSELQSQSNLVCRLLLEKKKQYTQMKQPASIHYIRSTVKLVCNAYAITPDSYIANPAHPLIVTYHHTFSSTFTQCSPTP